jgi:hypothetical protein
MVIRYDKGDLIKYEYLNIFPDQFVSEQYKKSTEWIKTCSDYFANVAYAQYVRHKDTFVKNYDLIKGILRREDFYEQEEVSTFVDALERDLDLPQYVKNYSIMNSPISVMVGEQSKRPDGSRVKAMDADSQAEELDVRSDIIEQYITQDIKQRILRKAALKGQKIDGDQLQQMTLSQLQETLDNYTSLAERWSNRQLECMKVEFNLKEKSEDGFRDLLITDREFFHIYEDNSKRGFGIKVENTKNVFELTTPDEKYTKRAYAVGVVNVMELSEIIERFPDLPKSDIDHLRQGLQDYGLITVQESNLFNPRSVGINSIKYDTYDPLVLKERMMIESDLKENNDELTDFLGLSTNVSAFGYKFVVIEFYWISKKKVGKVRFRDEQGKIQVALVDESYKRSPNQIGEVEWDWINQWYKGRKIGPDVYDVREFNLLDYCPIIGVVHEIKNTQGRSLVDILKPFQVIYNVCINQLYELLSKEKGKVLLSSIRHVPKLKDGDDQDALDMWELEARRRGVVFVDDSPENLEAPSSFNQFKELDLTRSQEMQTRYTLAQQIKLEAWELIGFTKERMANVAATQTATGTNAALSQSFAQTEPWFAQHEYVMNDVYQALIDACQYVESTKPQSTVSWVGDEGENAFISVTPKDIKNKDLKVFVTSRQRDQEYYQRMQQLSTEMLQNGVDAYTISDLYSTNSVRYMNKVFKSLKERREQLEDQQNKLKQQEMENQQKQAEMKIQSDQAEKQRDRDNENYNKAEDRINKKEIAIINAMSKNKGVNAMAPGDEDNLLESTRLSMEDSQARKELEIKEKKVESEAKEANDRLSIELEKLRVEREKMENDYKIEKLRSRKNNKKK